MDPTGVSTCLIQKWGDWPSPSQKGLRVPRRAIAKGKYRLRLNDALTAANYAGPEYACGPRQPQETQSAPLSNSSEGAQPQRLWS